MVFDFAKKIAFQNRVNDKHSQNLSLIQFNKGANKTLDHIAKEFDLDVNLIKTYNKWIRSGEIPIDKTYAVLIPTHQKVKDKTLAHKIKEIEPKTHVERTNIEETISSLQQNNSKKAKTSSQATINNLNNIQEYLKKPLLRKEPLLVQMQQ